MNHVLRALLLLGLLTTPGLSQTPRDSVPAESIDALFAPWSSADSPGAALAVVRDGEIVYSKGYGCAQLEYGIPITPQTVFHVASVSKQFTAAAVCLLADQGVLALDDEIQRWVPEVPDFGQKITLRHLLTHTSGMRDQWEMLAISGVRMDDVISTRHILDMVQNQRELNFDPGERFMYCNTGFTLLAETVSRASGQLLRDYCREHIFEPLGMEHTHFHDDHQRIVPNRAYSYSGSPGAGFENSVLSFANAGATSLFTTAEDLALWLTGLIEGEVGGPGVAFEMLEPGRLNDDSTHGYGLGLFLGEHRGYEFFGHGGSDAGFRSDVLFLPELGMGFVVLSNLASFQPGTLTRQVADLYLGFDVPGPPVPAPPARAATAGRSEPSTSVAGTRSIEKASDPVRVEVDPEVYDELVGRYELNGSVIDVRRSGDQLLVHLPERSAARLVPVSKMRYVAGPALIEFERNKETVASALTLTVDGTSAKARRLVKAGFDLAPFTGRYFSPEAGTFYDLIEEDGVLIARHRRIGDICLTPSAKDAFLGDRWFFGSIQFERDESRAVTGFRLYGGRVQRLWFERNESSE